MSNNYTSSMIASLKQLTEDSEDKRNNNDDTADSDSSDEEVSDAEQMNEEEPGDSPRYLIAKAQAAVDANIYDYQAHINLIKLCQDFEKWDKLRSVFEIMSSTFPLTEELWLSWINQERTLKEMTVTEMCDLYDRATTDYLNPKVWISYCSYVEDECEQFFGDNYSDKVLTVYERALIAVSLEPNLSPLIFLKYRSFEKRSAVLEDNRDLNDDEKCRVLKNYQRQLSIPFFQMENVYKEFTQEFGQDENVRKNYERALKIMKKIEPIQQKLDKAIDTEESTMDVFREYLEAEMTIGDPSRIRCIFERAIMYNALEPDLWSKYIQYTSMKLKDYKLADNLCKRAVRNVPWVPVIWQHYINICERLNKSASEVRKTFSEAQTSLYGEDSSNVYLAYLTFLRRLYLSCDEASAKQLMKTFRDVYHKAFENLAIFPDSLFALKNFVAHVEAKYFKNFDVFRKLFDKVVIDDSLDSDKWVEYLSLEEKFGTSAHLQKLYQRAFMYPRMSEPEKLIEKYLLHERVNGNLASLEIAIYKTELFRSQVEKVKEANRINEERQNEPKQKFEKPYNALKRPHGEVKSNKSAIKTEQPETKKQKLEGKNPFKKNKVGYTHVSENVSANEDIDKVKDTLNVSRTHSTTSQANNSEILKIQKDIPISNEENADVSVFLSNLDFKTTEDDIRAFLMSCGAIVGVSLAKNAAGKSKGFANCIFKTQNSVKEALKLNRELLCGRPVFVSNYKPSKKLAKSTDDSSSSQSAESKLVYTTGLERHKLFVSELSTETSRETLKEMFSKYGELKDVRIVTYKNGNSKGLAFVEFVSEDDAGKALVALDSSTIDGKQIKIAISNPPSRKGKPKQVEKERDNDWGSSSTTSDYRGKGRSQIQLVPRSLKAKTVSTPQRSDENAEGDMNELKDEAPKEVTKSLSNKDFAALLKETK
ncbi:spliceosome associated factor 3, U4/U6 recycling protein-like isoform X2 [Convolutriloba macropyga]|uniref:spliceosome associated factor 3, U4/U6 recycling protein-like isoform X2 n=1 Tax=Convolutriloba macropyga TaxID=536237 RepID=UPI003F51DAFA